MSWDLFVQDWGDVNSLNEIPDDFEPQSIGLRSEIIEKIQEAEPTVNFADPSWGLLENEQFSIEFNIGKSEDLQGFTMHVRGTELAIPCIGNILAHLGLKAADGSDKCFFDIERSKEKLNDWIEYRNRVLWQ